MLSESSQFSFPLGFSNNILSLMFKNTLSLETTSVDGQPFLNPLQFACLLPQTSQINVKQEGPSNVTSVENSKTNIKKQTLFSKANCKRGFDSLINTKAGHDLHEELECLEKKVKTKNVLNVLSQNDFLISDASTMHSNSPLPPSLNKNVSSFSLGGQNPNSQTEPNLVLKEKRNPKFKNYIKRQKAFQYKFDKEKKEIIFNIDEQSKQDTKEDAFLTREQVLKEDPLLLIYFYEKHLQFKKSPDFDGQSLKKI